MKRFPELQELQTQLEKIKAFSGSDFNSVQSKNGFQLNPEFNVHENANGTGFVFTNKNSGESIVISGDKIDGISSADPNKI